MAKEKHSPLRRGMLSIALIAVCATTAQLLSPLPSLEEEDQLPPTRPNLVFHMHVPKTAGRSLHLWLAKWLKSGSGNCRVDSCCTEWDDYLAQINASRHRKRQCRALNREMSIPGIFATREFLNTTMYLVSLFRSPVSRWISAARHMVVADHCSIGGNPTKSRLAGHCPPHVYDRNQAQYYFDIPFYRSNHPPPNATVADPWAHMSKNVQFIGITHYMHASTCLLAMELAQLDYFITKKTAFQICTNSTQPNFGGLPLYTGKLTSQRFVDILYETQMDAFIYPRVLELFSQRLTTLVRNRPAFYDLFHSTVGNLTTELEMWTRVSILLEKQDNASLLELIDGFQTKTLLTPGFKWK
jgi:hypothetical protein